MDLDYEGSRALLKGKTAPVYVLHGDPQSEFLMSEFAAKLVDYLLPASERESGLQRFDAAEGMDMDRVLDAAMPSLFSAQQVVVAQNAQVFTLHKRPGEDSKKPDAERYTNYGQLERLGRFLASPPEGVHIIFIAYEDMAPSGKGTGTRSERMLKRAFETIRKKGNLVRFRRLYTDGYIAWSSRRMQEAGLKPVRGAVELFVERAGEDLRHLAMEIEKLAAFLGDGGKVTEEIVRRQVSSCLDNFVSEMLHAMIMRRGAEAVEHLEKTLLGNSHPVFIVAAAASQMRLLWQARYLMDMGYYADLPREYRAGGPAYMAAESKKVAPALAAAMAGERSRSVVGIHSFRAFHIFQEARQMSLQDIESAIAQLLDIDCRLKGIRYPKRGSDEMMLEWLVADVAARPAAPGGRLF